MSKVKSPSYPWYPADFMADWAVQRMSIEEEGAYRRLLDHQWLNGFIPAELWELSIICKNMPGARMRKIWQKIGDLFPEVTDGQRQNGRLERVRKEQSLLSLGIQFSAREKIARRHGASVGSTVEVACAYCGQPGLVVWSAARNIRFTLQVDHVVPRARGGTNDDANLVLACGSCNASKGALSAEEFIAKSTT